MEVLEAMDAPSPVSPVMERNNSFGSDSSDTSLTEPTKSSKGGSSLPSGSVASTPSTAPQSPDTHASLSSTKLEPMLSDVSFGKSPSFKNETKTDAYGDVLTSFDSNSGTKLDNQVSGTLPPAGQIISDDDQCCCPCGGGITGDLAAICCCPFSLLHFAACVCFKCPRLYASRTVGKLRNLKRGKDGLEQGSSSSEDDDQPHLKSKSNSFVFSSNSHGLIDDKIAHSPVFESHRSPFFPSPDHLDFGMEK